jgi:hypothetical protein
MLVEKLKQEVVYLRHFNTYIHAYMERDTQKKNQQYAHVSTYVLQIYHKNFKPILWR